jgi:hypothetical protein
MKLNMGDTLAIEIDVDQMLAHLVLTSEDGKNEWTACGTVVDELRDVAVTLGGPLELGLLCPGCVLFLARGMSDHYKMLLDGPRIIPELHQMKKQRTSGAPDLAVGDTVYYTGKGSSGPSVPPGTAGTVQSIWRHGGGHHYTVEWEASSGLSGPYDRASLTISLAEKEEK